MKIVITGYNTCCLNKSGGVRVRVQKIYELLTKREDVEVEYFCPMTTDLQECDILHLFKLEPEYYNLVLKTKALGKKVVLSSVVNIIGGKKIDVYHSFINQLPILNSYKMMEVILHKVDAIIAETRQEAAFIVRHYGVKSSKIKIIGNGIETPVLGGSEIYNLIGGEKDYILQVGRIDANKNTLNTIKALKGTGVDLVIIGGADANGESYYQTCKDAANGDSHIHFLGWVDKNSSILASAYTNAKVLAVPSFQETFGLVAVEGASYGCNIAISNTLPILDFGVFDRCWTFDPNSVEDMKKKLLGAFQTSKDTITKEKVTSFFNWNAIIDEHLEIYKQLMTDYA